MIEHVACHSVVATEPSVERRRKVGSKVLALQQPNPQHHLAADAIHTTMQMMHADVDTNST